MDVKEEPPKSVSDNEADILSELKLALETGCLIYDLIEKEDSKE